MNGDRIPDVVLSAPSTNSSRGWVRAISGASGTKLSEIFGTRVNNRLGWSLSSGGDYNRDGVNDILATEMPVSTSGSGVVRVLNGRNLAQSLRSLSARGQYGSDTTLVDTDGDGSGELLISHNGVGVFVTDSGPKANPPAFQIYGRAGPGTGGAIPRISGRSTARSGGRQDVDLHGARVNSAAVCILAVRRFNVPLDGIGAPGASLLVDPVINFVVPTDARGNARFTIPISNDPRYVGGRFLWQWIVLDQGGNALGLTLSDAAEMTIGAR